MKFSLHRLGEIRGEGRYIRYDNKDGHAGIWRPRFVRARKGATECENSRNTGFERSLTIAGNARNAAKGPTPEKMLANNPGACQREHFVVFWGRSFAVAEQPYTSKAHVTPVPRPVLETLPRRWR